MKLGADVPGGVGGGLEDCGRAAMTGAKSWVTLGVVVRGVQAPAG